MQKLQELITKHREKLFYWTYIDLCNTDWDENKIHLAFDWWARWYASLSDLLFSTTFLSLLEWDDSKCDATRTKQHIKKWTFIEWYSIYESYHKINLALLKSDKERVEYINSFTL